LLHNHALLTTQHYALLALHLQPHLLAWVHHAFTDERHNGWQADSHLAGCYARQRSQQQQRSLLYLPLLAVLHGVKDDCTQTHGRRQQQQPSDIRTHAHVCLL
jgi:hypothetical protein